MPVTIASGRSVKIYAIQAEYALPPSNASQPFVTPELIQDDRYQTFKSVSIETSTELVDRTNTLSRGKQVLPSSYNATLNLNGYVSPYAAYGWFVGQLIDVRITWLSAFDEELYNIITRCTVQNISRNVSVEGAYEINITAAANFNFVQGDLRFITPLSNTIPGNIGWIPKTPQLNELPFAC